MSKYVKPFISKFQCGFRKGFSTQQCLLSMLEQWKSAADNQKRFGALLTDLSKAFNWILHHHLIAKLNAYRFCISLRLVAEYLTNRKQRTRINSKLQLMGKNFIWSSRGINFQGLFYSPSFSVTYFPLWMTLVLLVMQMKTQHALSETMWKMLFSNCKIRQKLFFNGLWITK